jgi:hypothetical protein
VNVTAGRAVYKRGGASRPLCVCEMLTRDAKLLYSFWGEDEA